MKITECENRFEVVLDGLVDSNKIQNITWALLEWLKKKEAPTNADNLPTDEDYLAALGPCGK